MRRQWRWLLAAAGLTGIVILVCACGVFQDRRTPYLIMEDAGITALRAGISADYPPIAFKQDGQITGVEAELAEKLEQELKVEIEFVELPFDQMIRALRTREIDLVMSGMSVTKKRQELVTFTEPYMQVGQVAVVRRIDREAYTPPSEAIYVNGLRVGYEVGTTGMTLAVETLLLAQLVKFNSAEDGLRALQAGEIEAFIHDQPTAWQLIDDESYDDLVVLTEKLTREDLAWAVRNEDTDLRNALNAVLRNWKKSGALQPIIDKWVVPPVD